MIVIKFTKECMRNICCSLVSKRMSSTSKCKVAVCQFTATNDKSENLTTVQNLVSDAVREKARMVFLPEASDYMASDKNESKSLSESLDGPLMKAYKEIAAQNKIWLSIGGFHEKIDDNTIYNSHIIIDDVGEIKTIYRKVHLFDVTIPEKKIFLRESDINVSGSQILPPIDTPAGALGLAICYDLRFPELSTLQTKLGANILTYPSAFTSSTGRAHWEVLLRARAIENQCYVIAAAQYGRHNKKRVSYGHAMIVDPWGNIKAECPKYSEEMETNQSIAFAEIDCEYMNKIRQEMPVQQHRRNDLYNLSMVLSKKKHIDDNDIFSFADKKILGSTVFYRSDYCYAFTNIRCVVPGHVLIATLRSAPRLVDLTQEEIADLFQTAVAVQRIMEMEHNTVSSTICVQDGHFAGQTVPHVHVHILPRKKGDFERNDDVYTHLANHDKDENLQPVRPLEEMCKEACKLRKYLN
nr:nitrilase and fragile histidine triad fusion protein NitFhit [Leptinotarsa decemlineata]